MPGNTIGDRFRFTSFGESHGVAVGGVIDGCPPGLVIDHEFIRQELERRKPSYPGATSRQEPDEVEFLSGLNENMTLGTPIAFLIRNREARDTDYQNISDRFRPSHADYTYFRKYGTILPGGGRTSGRETAARVVAGAIAKLWLKVTGIEIEAMVSQIGDVSAKESHSGHFDRLIAEAAEKGDTLGGVITCRINNVPAGLGEPVFDKLQADLAKAMLSIGTAKGFEYGLGFHAAAMKGSNYNDQMTARDGQVVFLSNHDGGIQGGISNGQEIFFRVGFKPVPSVKIRQQTATIQGEAADIVIHGRHDACHVPRLVVIVESMAALVLADHLLRYRNASRD
jgi:chorismate synthase